MLEALDCKVAKGISFQQFQTSMGCFQVSDTALQEKLSWSEKPIGELLLEPTVIYVHSVMNLADKVSIKASNGLCHEVKLACKTSPHQCICECRTFTLMMLPSLHSVLSCPQRHYFAEPLKIPAKC